MNLDTNQMHEYYCQYNDGRTAYILDRKTKPRMGQIITAYGSKWQVWYIESVGDRYKARLERVNPPIQKPKGETE